MLDRKYDPASLQAVLDLVLIVHTGVAEHEGAAVDHDEDGAWFR